MIIKLLCSIVFGLIKIMFGWLSLPSLPDSVMNYIDMLFSYLRSGLGLLFVFVNRDLVKILLPLVIAVVNFDKVYLLCKWIIKKIPMLGIE